MRRAARVIAGTLAALVLLTSEVGLPAAAAADGAPARSQPSPLWLVKSNDLVDLAQQAETDGVTLPAFTWIGCGGLSDVDQCLPSQVPIFTSYWRLHSWAEARRRGTAVFDIEPWNLTPRAQRRDPEKWICLAARLHRADPKLRVIITPFAKQPTTQMIPEDVAAARCGAYAVDVQSQFANGSPQLFASVIRTAVTAIRTINRKILILAGLATNHPRVQTAAHLVADYHRALAAGVQGFWLNANNWQKRNECTAAQGGAGCPQVGVRFLTDIGLATSIGAAGPAATSLNPASTPGQATTPTAAPSFPGPWATAPRRPATTPRHAATTPRPATGYQADATQPTPAPHGDHIPLALGNPLSGIVGVLALMVVAGLAGWIAHRRADAS